MLFLLTAYLQTLQHRDALEAGVAVLPLFLPLPVLAPFVGRVTAALFALGALATRRFIPTRA
ncbi:MAG: hypothetical protein ACXVXM_10230 [Nocardioidaceae bacterium]